MLKNFKIKFSNFSFNFMDCGYNLCVELKILKMISLIHIIAKRLNYNVFTGITMVNIRENRSQIQVRKRDLARDGEKFEIMEFEISGVDCVELGYCSV